MSIDLELTNCVKTLREGGIIIFPNETGWSIGCDLTNTKAVELILQEKNTIYPAIFLNDPGKLTKYVREIPDMLWDLIEFSNKPLHVVLEKVVNVPSVLSENEECIFRIVKDPFSINLISKFGKPIFATVLNDQTHPPRQSTILNQPGYVVNLRLSSKSNTENLVILRLSPLGKIQFIKK